MFVELADGSYLNLRHVMHVPSASDIYGQDQDGYTYRMVMADGSYWIVNEVSRRRIVGALKEREAVT